MKNILIIGKNSYLAKEFAKWLSESSADYGICSVSAKDGEWEDCDFDGFDSVVMFSGIVHRKENRHDESLYFEINALLPEKICKKALLSGVKQFVYISSMSVYGQKSGIITEKTAKEPKTFYGKSKLEGEKRIFALQNENFAVAAVRCPMVYGFGSKGNYTRLSKMAKQLSAFPEIKNERSMIFIENLCEFLRLLCESSEGGIYCPQNSEYVCTSDMVRQISSANGKKIKMTGLFNPIIRLAAKKVNVLQKLFGSLCYDKKISEYDFGDYNVCGFEESIILSEQKTKSGIV